MSPVPSTRNTVVPAAVASNTLYAAEDAAVASTRSTLEVYAPATPCDTVSAGALVLMLTARPEVKAAVPPVTVRPPLPTDTPPASTVRPPACTRRPPAFTDTPPASTATKPSPRTENTRLPAPESVRRE